MAQTRSVRLDRWWDPEVVFEALFADEDYAFWLDGGVDAEAGMSYQGAATPESRIVTAAVSDGTFTVSGPSGVESTVGSVFDFLRGELRITQEEAQETGPFPLGWFGWLGYELGAQAAGAPIHPSNTPDAALFFTDRGISFDHAARTVRAVALGPTGPEADALMAAWVHEVEAALAGRSSVPRERPAGARAGGGGVAHWRHSPDAYAGLVLECQESIRRGDAYQLCLTNTITVDGDFDPLVTYLRLRETSPTHHGGLVRFGEYSLLSASPEQFLRVGADGLMTTKPIKGTRPRGASVAADIELRAELESSDKEQAENLMIVDLMRNDLGRVAALGSVSVTSLLAVESYAQVHQLVSTVEARLAPGLTSIDALEAAFPAGSMTGAPKISAMGILADLEAGPRGIYAGAFGYFGVDGSLDLAMVIRSIVLGPDGASIGTGGGITALSVPADEVEETRIKARALLAALGVDPEPGEGAQQTG